MNQNLQGEREQVSGYTVSLCASGLGMNQNLQGEREQVSGYTVSLCASGLGMNQNLQEERGQVKGYTRGKGTSQRIYIVQSACVSGLGMNRVALYNYVDLIPLPLHHPLSIHV